MQCRCKIQSDEKAYKNETQQVEESPAHRCAGMMTSVILHVAFNCFAASLFMLMLMLLPQKVFMSQSPGDSIIRPMVSRFFGSQFMKCRKNSSEELNQNQHIDHEFPYQWK